MDYRKMARDMAPDTRYNGGPFQVHPNMGMANLGWSAANIAGPRPGNMMGGFSNVPYATTTVPKNTLDVQAIIQQIMQGMAQPKRDYGPNLRNQITNPLPDNAG